LTVSPIIDGSGNVVGASKVARDISERKRAEDTLRERDYALEMARTELARVSRVTALGELTTSIAHEVAQPLGGMIASAAACTRWLAAEPPDIAEARSALDNIAADGKRAREVIARIRALAKRQVPRMELLDINRKILDVLALTEQELRSHNIALRTELDRTLPHVAGDRVQLQQVLLNLIVNAIEAMSGVHDRARINDRFKAGRREWRASRGARFRHRAGPGARRAGVRGVLHDQGGRHRHRLVDQPFDRRGARRAAVGGRERAARGGLPVLAAG
jgi:C4-dicarboxylate-specific signal transduction histidine kinase